MHLIKRPKDRRKMGLNNQVCLINRVRLTTSLYSSYCNNCNSISICILLEKEWLHRMISLYFYANDNPVCTPEIMLYGYT